LVYLLIYLESIKVSRQKNDLKCDKKLEK